MKNKLGLLIFLAVIAGSGSFVYYRDTAICRNPIEYTIGTVDSRFGISRDKFLAGVKEAEAVWEKSIGRELFEYQSDSGFKINLIFDERQKQTLEANQSEMNIEVSRSEYEKLLKEYTNLKASYETKLNSYNNSVDEFERRLEIYNDKIAKLNTRGGATPKEYQEMEEERKYLEDRKRVLDDMRDELSSMVVRVNSLGAQVNYMAEQLNIEVEAHNQIFGEAREFDQGEYNGKEINIYQFDEMGDLRLVLAHELGHALGIDHVENPKSIMYYLMDQQDIKNPVVSGEDRMAFVERCKPGNFLRILSYPRILTDYFNE